MEALLCLDPTQTFPDYPAPTSKLQSSFGYWTMHTCSPRNAINGTTVISLTIYAWIVEAEDGCDAHVPQQYSLAIVLAPASSGTSERPGQQIGKLTMTEAGLEERDNKNDTREHQLDCQSLACPFEKLMGRPCLSYTYPRMMQRSAPQCSHTLELVFVLGFLV